MILISWIEYFMLKASVIMATPVIAGLIILLIMEGKKDEKE